MGRVGKEALLGPFWGEVPGGTGQGIKVLVPVLVELPGGALHLPLQAVVQHLRHGCMPTQRHILHAWCQQACVSH